ncbi:hypothetical protein ACFQ67_35295, partial [Streptomyces sp. NPDC056488]|uniref:hypothetical protein n=1 Tax=Streptomyces sp. NPDC056488 TaxID=3345836 RepID=UPI00368A95AD
MASSKDFTVKIDPTEVASRFSYHQPSTEDIRTKHELIRFECGVLAEVLLEHCPESREPGLGKRGELVAPGPPELREAVQ